MFKTLSFLCPGQGRLLQRAVDRPARSSGFVPEQWFRLPSFLVVARLLAELVVDAHASRPALEACDWE